MRLLLDTHVVLGELQGTQTLGPRARARLEVLTLLSADARLADYDVALVDASV